MDFEASVLIDLLGGTTAVARLLGIKPPSVHEWRGKVIPEDKLIRLAAHIERASGAEITRQMLRPDDWQDIWPELAHPEGAAHG